MEKGTRQVERQTAADTDWLTDWLTDSSLVKGGGNRVFEGKVSCLLLKYGLQQKCKATSVQNVVVADTDWLTDPL